MGHMFSRTFVKNAVAAASLIAISGVATGGVGLATAGTAFASTSSQSTLKAPQANLVALGDSITFGYNLSDTDNNTLPSQSAFPMLIGKNDHLQVSDLGMPGWTSADLLAALQSSNFERAIQGASVVTLDIGSNDLLRLAEQAGLLNQAASATPVTLTAADEQEFANAIEQFGKNFAEIMVGIRMQTNAPVVVYNLYNPFPAGTALNTLTEKLQTSMNDIIVKVASTEKNVVIADAHTAFAGHQLMDVRLAEHDVHPTVAGQTVLAQVGETALQPLLSQIKPGTIGTTSMLDTSLTQNGGAVQGTLNGTAISWTVPTGAVSQATNADVTSQADSALTPYIPTADQAVAEAGLNLMSGVTLSAPYTLTLSNPAITKNAAVFVADGLKLTPVTVATVSAGKVVIQSKVIGDYVVLVPKVATVTGGTEPKTGLPMLTEGAIALVLLALGSGLVVTSRKKRRV